MRVLKPEIDEINKRIPADKPTERQQATMQLYSQVGVSPMSGCLPMLLQMPILFAMFSFFPASIELRQQSFLWAQDLSAYDAIISWEANIPLISSIFGNHVSLFCLLMAATNIISTKLTMSSQPSANDQMPAMKWMMYLMPVMFLFMFNNYASGLSYYYFLSSLITIGQTYAIRATINEEKLRAQLMEAKKNKKKNPKKSSFMERLEKAQREQQKALKKNRK
jgi:YidC/Oxa1 family membrane protein insertase